MKIEFKLDNETFYSILSLIIIVGTFMWFWNFNDVLSLHFLKHDFTVKLSTYSGFMFLFGFIASEISNRGKMNSTNLKNKEYEKKLNSTSVDSNKDKARIEALERKIETLEKALESKLDR
ncbi:hypothetical protein IJ732_05970 [bacterium]|nr:hypothetical protein [bacterium]